MQRHVYNRKTLEHKIKYKMTKYPRQKIVILGGNAETGALVEVANKMGLYTIVIDPSGASPSKKYASISYDIDVTDIEKVSGIIDKENADGVIVGVADPLVPYYYEICKRQNFISYANSDSIHCFTSKSNFASACKKYGISTIPNYQLNLDSNREIASLPYPVVIKPVDAAAGVGIGISRSQEEFRDCINRALQASRSKNLIIEKMMECDDIFVYYTFIDGKAYLSATADRYKTKKQGQFSSVCIGASYPSRYTERFKEEVHPKLEYMFSDLKILNGVLLIQFFVDNQHFYAYDPGFRLQGEGPHIYLKHINKFDHREMLIRFSLTGKMHESGIDDLNDVSFNNLRATTLWILLREGTIGCVTGLEAIKSNPNVISVLQRFNAGDSITPDMIGTERQVFARLYTVSQTLEESNEVIEFIHRNLSIISTKGENMILDQYRHL